jgi:hypothetical protein
MAFVSASLHDRRHGAHNLHHLIRVENTASYILGIDFMMKDDLFKTCTMIVAFIHDYDGIDHKFEDKDGSARLKLVTFLQSLNLIGYEGKDVTDELIKIASHVSFSKEYNGVLAGTLLDFASLLNTPNLPEAHLIRDIVSDGDKLDAIGLSGMFRLLVHTRHVLAEKHGRAPTDEEMSKDMQHHANVKLLHLKDDYIRTKTGKELAVVAHAAFVSDYNSYFMFG